MFFTVNSYPPEGWVQYNAWDPTHKGNNISLSNSNRTAAIAAPNGSQSVLAVFGKSSGNWMWEITIDSIGSGLYLGVAYQSVNLNTWLGAVENMWTIGAANETASSISNHVGESGFSNTDGGPNGFTTGRIITMAMKVDTSELYAYRDGVLMYYEQFGPHISNIMAKALYTGWTETVYPCFLLNNTAGGTRQVTANFGHAAFSYPVAGYSAIHGPTT